ncbi:MAG: hypothetical protein R2876_00670 [Eubacteriales bacterium]
MQRIPKCILIISVFLFLLLVALFPEISIDAASNGLMLFIESVLPSILPFLIGTSILLQTGFVPIIGAILSPVFGFLFGCPGESGYVFLSAGLSGYPIGAKLSAELFDKGILTRDEAQLTLYFTSITSPLFISGVVAISLFNAPYLSGYLLFSHYIAAILTGVIMRIRFGKKKMVYSIRAELKKALHNFRLKNNFFSKQTTIGNILKNAVTTSLITVATICGFIILFNVLINLLNHLGFFETVSNILSPLLTKFSINPAVIKPLISGSIEMTVGVNMASKISSKILMAYISAFLLGFGGLSIIMQTYAFISQYKLSAKNFIAAKFMQGCLSSLILAASLKVIPLTVTTSSLSANTPNVYQYLGLIFFLLCSTTLLAKLKKY